jgi:hypothetical protein
MALSTRVVRRLRARAGRGRLLRLLLCGRSRLLRLVVRLLLLTGRVAGVAGRARLARLRRARVAVAVPVAGSGRAYDRGEREDERKRSREEKALHRLFHLVVE